MPRDAGLQGTGCRRLPGSNGGSKGDMTASGEDGAVQGPRSRQCCDADMPHNVAAGGDLHQGLTPGRGQWGVPSAQGCGVINPRRFRWPDHRPQRPFHLSQVPCRTDDGKGVRIARHRAIRQQAGLHPRASHHAPNCRKAGSRTAVQANAMRRAKGMSRSRVPFSAKIALARAGAAGGVPGSPMPRMRGMVSCTLTVIGGTCGMRRGS